MITSAYDRPKPRTSGAFFTGQNKAEQARVGQNTLALLGYFWYGMKTGCKK